MPLFVAWIVPSPGHWRELDSLQVRVRDGDEVALRIRWEEATNTLGLVDAASLRLRRPAGEPGSVGSLKSTFAGLICLKARRKGRGPRARASRYSSLSLLRVSPPAVVTSSKLVPRVTAEILRGFSRSAPFRSPEQETKPEQARVSGCRRHDLANWIPRNRRRRVEECWTRWRARAMHGACATSPPHSPPPSAEMKKVSRPRSRTPPAPVRNAMLAPPSG